FAVSGTADVVHKRRAQNSSDPILGDDAAELVRRDTEQGEIEQAWFFRKAVFFECDSGQRRGAGQIKCEHESIFGEQLFFTFLFLRRFLAVLLDGEIVVTATMFDSGPVHIIKSQTCARSRVISTASDG